MYGIYGKELGFFSSLNGEKIELYWITARAMAQTIPGGVKLLATDETGLLSAPYYDPAEWQWAVDEMNIELNQADLKKGDDERESRGSFETMDYFRSKMSPVFVSSLERKKFQFVFAYRESEAAKVAFDAGFRAERRDDVFPSRDALEGYEKGMAGASPIPSWSWPALGKVQSS